MSVQDTKDKAIFRVFVEYSSYFSYRGDQYFEIP